MYCYASSASNVMNFVTNHATVFFLGWPSPSLGCVLAHRLAKDAGKRVLLLENGPSDRGTMDISSNSFYSISYYIDVHFRFLIGFESKMHYI